MREGNGWFGLIMDSDLSFFFSIISSQRQRDRIGCPRWAATGKGGGGHKIASYRWVGEYWDHIVTLKML